MELQRWYAANGDSGLHSLSGGAGMGGEGRTDTHRLVKEMKESLYKDDQMMSGHG
jgi:hypothetical protein